jgi:diacylglycerol kinase family enzyme
MNREKLHFFAESLAGICARSFVAQGRPLRWLVITNPVAGSFVMRSRWKECRQALEEGWAAAQANPLRENYAPAGTAVGSAFASCGVVSTDGPGSTAEIVRVLIDEVGQCLHGDQSSASASVSQASAAPFYLLITAGGDGTSLEALSVLYHAPDSVCAHIAVLRLPMGTGNDGADSPELARALELLIKPSRIEYAPALQLVPAPGGPAAVNAAKLAAVGLAGGPTGSKNPYLAFNILSVGLDAFVTHMTNKMKGSLPGDFYKFWVDIASLLSDRLYKVDFLDVRALDGQGGEVRSFREKLLLLAVGASGHRTYGSQKKILPDDRNICAVKQMSLLRKLALKGLFTTGEHIDKPETILFNAYRVEISGSHPILAQMDGETILLQREDFPAVIELTEPVIPVLKPAD